MVTAGSLFAPLVTAKLRSTAAMHTPKASVSSEHSDHDRRVHVRLKLLSFPVLPGFLVVQICSLCYSLQGGYWFEAVVGLGNRVNLSTRTGREKRQSPPPLFFPLLRRQDLSIACTTGEGETPLSLLGR